MGEGKDSAIHVRSSETLSENWYKLEKVTFDQIGRDGTVLLVRQLRIPACLNGDGPMLVEACAGMVEPGDGPAEAVRKEAEQEVGYRLRGVRTVFELHTSPGASAERVHLFIAGYGPGGRVGNGGGVAGEGGGSSCWSCRSPGSGRWLRQGRSTTRRRCCCTHGSMGCAVGRVWATEWDMRGKRFFPAPPSHQPSVPAAHRRRATIPVPEGIRFRPVCGMLPRRGCGP